MGKGCIVSSERILYCDAPDCDTHGSHQHPGWLTLTGEGKPLHFCNLDCAMKFAAAHSEPPTVIGGPHEDTA